MPFGQFRSFTILPFMLNLCSFSAPPQRQKSSCSFWGTDTMRSDPRIWIPPKWAPPCPHHRGRTWGTRPAMDFRRPASLLQSWRRMFDMLCGSGHNVRAMWTRRLLRSVLSQNHRPKMPTMPSAKPQVQVVANANPSANQFGLSGAFIILCLKL